MANSSSSEKWASSIRSQCIFHPCADRVLVKKTVINYTTMCQLVLISRSPSIFLCPLTVPCPLGTVITMSFELLLRYCDTCDTRKHRVAISDQYSTSSLSLLRSPRISMTSSISSKPNASANSSDMESSERELDSKEFSDGSNASAFGLLKESQRSTIKW